MEKMEEHFLEHLARYGGQVEPPRPGLSERIIAAAAPVRQKSMGMLAMQIQEFLEDFLLPKPAFALAIMLMVGVVIGIGAPQSPPAAEEEFSYLDDSGAIL